MATPLRLTNIEVPASGVVAFAHVVVSMDFLDSMYGPDTAEDYIKTIEAIKAELDARVQNATTWNPHGRKYQPSLDPGST